MKVTLQHTEYTFAVISLLFYSDLLAFASIFNPSSSSDLALSTTAVVSPLTLPLQIIQHGIFLIALFLILCRWKSSLSSASRSPLFWLLVVLMMLSFTWSDFPPETLRKSLALFETITFGVYLGSRFSLREQLNFLALACSIIIFASLLFSIINPSFAIEIGNHGGAWRGPFIQKNEFAKVIVLCFISIYMSQPNNSAWNFFRFTCLSCSIILILLSTSKTALFVVILLLLSTHFYKIIYSLLQRNSILTVPIACLSIITFLISSLLISSNLEGLVIGTGKNLTLTGRTTIWSAVAYKISERPLLGYGYVGFWRDIYGESAYIGKVFGHIYLPKDSHNGFLELLLAFGFIGAIIFGLCFFHTLVRSLKLPLSAKSRVAYWPLVYLSFIVFYNQTENTLILHNSIFFVLLIALILSNYSKQDASSNAAVSESL
ncbi:MAG: O-antigen ligase family protein [Cyanobacteria bacterium P01_G01_bin.49]